MKPPKKVYPHQEEVYLHVRAFAESVLVPAVTEAYLTGSAVRREFGIYVEEYLGHQGSDIDLVVMIKKSSIPLMWKNLNTEKTWFNLYSGGIMTYQGTPHRLDLLVVKEGMEEFAKQRMNELGWGIDKIK
jgi:hypothetical protein